MISAQRAYTMLGNQSLWQTANLCHRVLTNANIPYAIVGGVAVCLHGYQRNTTGLELLVRSAESNLIRQHLEQAGFTWSEENCEFRSPTDIPVQFVISETRAGKSSEVLFPDPENSQVVIEVEGLRVLTLARLIETKLACGEGNLRRTHKDFADVVELVAINKLGRGFARHLHESVRTTFRELVIRARSDG